MSSVEIRPITTPAHAQAAAALQHMFTGETLSPDFMLAVHHNGGLLIGAFNEDTLLGLAFGVISLIPSRDRIDPVAAARLKLYLHTLVVTPTRQGQGLGRQLLVGARDYAMRLGLRLITWALDPLSSCPAWLSIGKMGGISSGYLTGSGNPGGLLALAPSDSLEVEWWVTNNRVQRRTTRPRTALDLTAFLEGGGVVVNATSLDETQQAAPKSSFLDDSGNIILVEIPHDFSRLQAHAWPLVTAWRAHARAVLQHYFSKGYFITDFVRHHTGILPERDFYVLTSHDA